MFEAIHGSAPDIAGKDIANPSGLLNGAIMMLSHIGQVEKANLIHNAWLAALESGYHTADIYGPDSRAKVGTKEFGEVVIANLGNAPKTLKSACFKAANPPSGNVKESAPHKPTTRTLIGVDVFVHWNGEVEKLGDTLKVLAGDALKLQTVSCKGLKVWPDYVAGMNLTDQFNCRFKKTGATLSHEDIARLITHLAAQKIDFIKTEQLYEYDGKVGYTLGQGE
jgi:isocitrate dehydrogenase